MITKQILFLYFQKLIPPLHRICQFVNDCVHVLSPIIKSQIYTSIQSALFDHKCICSPHHGEQLAGVHACTSLRSGIISKGCVPY
jgi:hypothetical protein